MKSLFCVLALLIVGLAAVNGRSHIGGPACTTTTCPPGPVTVLFSSSDCTGAGEFAMYEENFMDDVGTCFKYSSGDGSYRFDLFADHLTSIEVNNPSCDLSLPNATYTVVEEYFGVCRPSTSSSTMYLHGVNDSYVKPQIVTQTVPLPSYDSLRYTAQCSTPTNCTQPNGDEAALITTTNTAQCVPSSSEAIFGVVYNGSCLMDTESGGYVSHKCTGPHSYSVSAYSGLGCQNLYNVQSFRHVCESGFPYSSTCTWEAPPATAPLATAPGAGAGPSSQAAPFLPSLILILASALTILF